MHRDAPRKGDPGPDEPAPPTDAQLRAIAALVAGQTMTEAASVAGVDRSTLYRWRTGPMADPPFLAELNRLRQEARGKVRAELRSLAAEAVATIQHVMADAQAPPAVRVAAAWKLLEALGALGPEEPIGPTDAREVAQELLQDEQYRALSQFALP